MNSSEAIKLFGYAVSSDALLHLEEVTIQADVDEFRSLAKFLNHTADLIEKHGVDFGHEHYNRWIGKSRERHCDLIVAGPNFGKT